MIYRKLPAALLFLFSFVVIAIGGYQCATRGGDGSGGEGSREEFIFQQGESNGGGYRDANPPRYDSDPDYHTGGGGDRLPQEPENENCPRSKYRDWEQQYGAMGNLRFRGSSLEDFRFGQRQNFDLNCERIFLSMNHTSGRNYKGSLSLVYAIGKTVHRVTVTSGREDEDNKHNRWESRSWRADRRDRVNNKFHAIFEDKHTAIILRLEDVREREVRDGEVAHLGAGEIYYKMFRYSTTAGRNDKCYQNGAYMKDMEGNFVRNKVCWRNTVGPFSCLPDGAFFPRRGRIPDMPNIDITGDLRCYNLLGEFFNVELEQAFNVGDVDELQ